MTEAYIYEAIRTPRGRGKKDGSLHSVKPIDLVVGLIDELGARHPGLDPKAIDDIVLGVVSLAEGAHPASIEQATTQAGFPVGALALLDEVNMKTTVKIQRGRAARTGPLRLTEWPCPPTPRRPPCRERSHGGCWGRSSWAPASAT